MALRSDGLSCLCGICQLVAVGGVHVVAADILDLEQIMHHVQRGDPQSADEGMANTGAAGLVFLVVAGC